MFAIAAAAVTENTRAKLSFYGGKFLVSAKAFLLHSLDDSKDKLREEVSADCNHREPRRYFLASV
ncbi:hypothetical protein ACFLVH_06380 [Chloroflexota bacterium]